MRRKFRLAAVLTVFVVLTLVTTSIGSSPTGRQVGVAESAVSDTSSVRLDHDLATRMNDVAERLLSESNVAGFSVAVERRGTVVFADGYGFADVQGVVPASADT